VDKRTVFRERSSSNSVSFWKQIMFKDKYANIFSSRMNAIVFAILEIFFATRVVLISFPDLLWTKLRPREIWSRDVFRPIARERVDCQCSGCSWPVSWLGGLLQMFLCIIVVSYVIETKDM